MGCFVMKRLLIVDGSNLLFQMFYGMPARIINREGKAIQGTLGFVGALLKMIRMVQPDGVAVFFDGEYTSERSELDGDYKANRPDYSQMAEEETPFSQLPDIYAALDVLKICHAETTVCETDDWIAGYARQCGEEMELVIASQDSDFFQLITDRVRVLRYRGKNSVLCDPNYIREKLGISPEQYADYKALVGDTADNIRGADKIGPKTASQLLRQFGCLEDILNGAQQVQKPSVRVSLIENTARLRQNYRLIYLDGKHNLPFKVDELAWSDPGMMTGEVLHLIGIQ